MPRPPDFDELKKIKFITNYFLQGCVPPYSLVVEFSQEPAKDLWLMLLSFDLEDIIKSWIRPRGARHGNPQRHGGKRKPRRIPLDPNELVGGIAREHIDSGGLYEGIKLPGARALFHLSDKWDNVAWSAAILEGLTDLGFETLWGIVTNHPETCPQLGFIDRQRIGYETVLGLLGWNPMGLPILNSEQGFSSTSGLGAVPLRPGGATAVFSGVAVNDNNNTQKDCRIGFRDAGGVVLAESQFGDLGPFQSRGVEVQVELHTNQPFFWSAYCGQGAYLLKDGRCFGWSGTWM